jgi:cold shock CspA family protein
MARGRVKWYRRDEGLGCITPDSGGRDVLFERGVVVGDEATLTPDSPVDYDAVPGPGSDGPIATRVALVA